MNKVSTSQDGFTMIEVMISVLITAIAALGFIAMYMTETQAGSFTRHSTEASVLATDKLEQLRTASAPASSNDAVDSLGVAGGIFTRRWTITVATNYTDVVVAVGWDEDETSITCSADTDCTRTAFCRPTLNTCAGRVVLVRGRRNN